ncbi:hypothetical protein NDU88_008485 [Pleurodeles waltl]|uniref:Uncharacterized protein n=1 Tax=Pleurodeles waltl TaxID=8319 RepID=A0AAV7ND98_PLEWA|nr:hypothetical protein NDU88_008485 [Pleurodeles waltl]
MRWTPSTHPPKPEKECAMDDEATEAHVRVLVCSSCPRALDTKDAQDFLLLREHRLVIPKNLQQRVFLLAHVGHQV